MTGPEIPALIKQLRTLHRKWETEGTRYDGGLADGLSECADQLKALTDEWDRTVNAEHNQLVADSIRRYILERLQCYLASHNPPEYVWLDDGKTLEHDSDGRRWRVDLKLTVERHYDTGNS